MSQLNHEQLTFFYNEVMDLFNWDEEIEEEGIDPLNYVRDEYETMSRHYSDVLENNRELKNHINELNKYILELECK